jgi:nucleoside-diphosphate-sugar epimerase
LGEAALLVKELTNSKSKIIYGDAESDQPHRGSLDISKAQKHFNYQPRVDIIDGIRSYINWMKTYKNVD